MLGRCLAAPSAYPDWQSLDCQSEGPPEATCGSLSPVPSAPAAAQRSRKLRWRASGPTALKTLGSLVAAPGLMIVQKAAIKSQGGGERAEKHGSADPGTKES